MQAKVNRSIIKAIIFIAMSFAIYPVIIWAIIENRSYDQKSAAIEFLNNFPPFLRSITTITYITILCALIAFIFSLNWIKKSHGLEKVAAIIILLLAVGITLLMLFQLM